MNIKKIAITAAAAGVMLSAVTPAFANHWNWNNGDVDIDIENDDTNVTNNVTTQANTGFNQVVGWGWFGGGSITTGNALAASEVDNTVNFNLVDLCGCLGDFDDVDIDIDNDDTNVTNNVTTQANTGFNQVIKKGTINTGNAVAGALVTNVVNTNVVQ